jgi:hypothetical protein
LMQAGITCVTLSPEADHQQLEDVTACCPVPCSIVVFGRPALATTRAQLPAEYLGRVLEDRRGLRLIARRQGGLTVFRPVQPFDLRGCRNEQIRAAHLVMDLAGSADPIADWRSRRSDAVEPFHWNYDRSLA